MIPSDTRKTVAACLAVMYAMSIASNAGAASAVPDGFESIAAGHDERVEITFLGESLGLFRVFVTPDTLRIEDPQDLLRKLGTKISAAVDPSTIIESLSAPMPRNGSLACAGLAGADGCGYVDTDSAALIYNEMEGNADLFLSREWLGSEERDIRFRDPTSDSSNALIHQQTLNYSGGRGYKSLAVSGTGALGLTPGSFIGANWNFTHSSFSGRSNNRTELSDIYFRNDVGRQHYVQVGRMDNRNLASPLGGNFGFSMLPVGAFDGVRIGTTLAYANPESAVQGTPVTVLLSRDSRIDAYRGNELLGTFYMRAGVNSVDTSRFPEGTYPVLLRIFESDMLTRTQTTPFTKTGGGVGFRSRQWFAQAGRTAESNGNDTATVAAGVRYPVTDGLSITTGVAHVDGGSYGETEFDWRHAVGRGLLSATASLSIGNDGSRGSTQQLSFSNTIAWSIYRYRMRGAACDGESLSHRDVGCYDMLNATVSIPMGDWSTMLGYTYNRSAGRVPGWPIADTDSRWLPIDARRVDDVARAVQLSVSRSATWRTFNANFSAGVFANRSAGGSTVYGGYIGATLSMADPAARSGAAATFTSAGVEVRGDSEKTLESYALNRNWSWQGQSQREIALGLSGNGSDSLTGGLQGRWNGRYGDAAASITNTYRNGGPASSPSLSGSYSSTFAASRSGLYVGASASQADPLAGYAVKVTENDEAAGMAAEVSGGSSSNIKIGFGQRTLLPVTAFSPATVEVSDAGVGSSTNATSVIDGLGRQAVFMVPGQLMTRTVRASIIYTYVGQAVDINGRPLADGVILNGAMPSLDAEGGFIAELDRKEDNLFVIEGSALMRCPLHVKRRQDVLMIVGKVQCEMATVNALPEILRSQARVQKLLEQRYVTSTQRDERGSGASH